jgi:hypothetical protein
MSHITIEDVTSSVEIQSGAVVSKVVHRDDDIDLTVLGFDAGEGLTEHTAARPAIVQVLSGQLRLTVEGDEVDATSCWSGRSRADPRGRRASQAVGALTLREREVAALAQSRLTTKAMANRLHLRSRPPSRIFRTSTGSCKSRGATRWTVGPRRGAHT